MSLPLTYPEACALLAHVTLELARTGKHTVADLMSMGRKCLGVRQVIPGVEVVLDEVQVECTFPDGTKLVTIHSPVSLEDGDLSQALYGSFLPVPSTNSFPPRPPPSPTCLTLYPPGHVFSAPGSITLNPHKQSHLLTVTNTADRPIQVGSHYHFAEANPYLKFDRGRAYGRRLNIASGTAVRFEPGEGKTVSLIDIGGRKVVRGGNGLIDGEVGTPGEPTVAFMKKVKEGGFEDMKEVRFVSPSLAP